MRRLPALAAACVSTLAAAQTTLRVATFNIEDLRTEELVSPASDRARAAAETLQRIRPTIVLINEIVYDQPGSPGYDAAAGAGTNARRLAELLREPLAPGVRGLRYRAFSAPTNTGLASGFDLDRSGAIAEAIPAQPPANADGAPVAQTGEGRAYGGDAWGFGTFPGQYGMALLVDDRLEIVLERVRTFRLFPWGRMPGALLPADPETGEPWYAGEAGELFRLSSKSHWDIPVRLPGGTVLHVLASHPTPPAFDGPEQRNKRRNHDEIRFWRDYIDNAAYIVDDRGRVGGLPAGEHFVILGDLNADPDKGNSLGDPIGNLLASPAIGADPRPVSEIDLPGLDPDDTAAFRLRVDYVLPSAGIGVLAGGVWRHGWDSTPPPSDHFPVWLDISVPPAAAP